MYITASEIELRTQFLKFAYKITTVLYKSGFTLSSTSWSPSW